MTKWILCFTAMTSFSLLAAPSKEEVNAIEEFTHGIHTELKTEINDFSSQKVKNTVHLNVSDVAKQNEKLKKEADLIAKVTYLNDKSAD